MTDDLRDDTGSLNHNQTRTLQFVQQSGSFSEEERETEKFGYETR